MPHVLVAGPAPWNILVRVATLPDAHPQTILTSGHQDTPAARRPARPSAWPTRASTCAPPRTLARPSGATAVGEVVDTNGAGDAFAAGLLLGHVEGPP